jgi:hypothetical protein
MSKRGDLCLPPKVLARVLKVLIPVKLILFTWGLFAPATPLSVVLILAAIALLAPAYFVKIFLKHGGEEGTLWTRVAGCMSSAMIALGSFALAWGSGSGLRLFTSHNLALSWEAELQHFTLPEIIGTLIIFGLYTLVLVLGSFIDTLESALKDEWGKNQQVDELV